MLVRARASLAAAVKLKLRPVLHIPQGRSANVDTCESIHVMVPAESHSAIQQYDRSTARTACAAALPWSLLCTLSRSTTATVQANAGASQGCAAAAAAFRFSGAKQARPQQRCHNRTCTSLADTAACCCQPVTHVAYIQCSPEAILIHAKQVMKVGLLSQQHLAICTVHGDNIPSLRQVRNAHNAKTTPASLRRFWQHHSAPLCYCWC